MVNTLITVAALHWVLLVTPGANLLVVSNLAASGARARACAAALGVTLVAGIWAAIAALGVNAVFVAHPLLRLGMQVAGGGYLLFLAVRLWRSGASRQVGASRPMSTGQAFRLGFMTNILNPKSALFFGSVFATALPEASSALLLAMAVGIVVLNALCWHLFLALAFSHRRVQGVYSRQRATVSRTAGVLVGAFGLRLISSALAEMRAR